MYYEVFRILEHTEADKVVRSLAQCSFADGKATAGGGAREVKHNLQARAEGNERSESEKIVLSSLDRHEAFHAFAMPKSMFRPTFSRYEPGMQYGSHIDSSLMG